MFSCFSPRNANSFPCLGRTEIVLSALIASFHFELAPNTEYEWKLGGIVSPGVKDDPVPKVPLLVSLCENRQRDH